MTKGIANFGDDWQPKEGQERPEPLNFMNFERFFYIYQDTVTLDDIPAVAPNKAASCTLLSKAPIHTRFRQLSAIDAFLRCRDLLWVVP